MSDTPVESTTSPNPRKRNKVWWTLQMLFQLWFVVWLRYRARGFEKLQEIDGAMLLINHQSMLDPILAGLPLSRPIAYLARDTLFKVPGLSWLFHHNYVISISRTAASSATMKQTLACLEQGYLVGVFPEGTRAEDGEVGEFKPGFILMVRHSNRPIVPVGIAGADKALPRDKWFPRPRRVRVVCGEPFPAEVVKELTPRGRQRDFLDYARQRVTECVDEARRWRG